MTTSPPRPRSSYRIGHGAETERAHIDVVVAGRRIPARILDESAMGLRLELPAGATLPFHQPLKIVLPGGVDQARVVWSQVEAGRLLCGLERIGTESDHHSRVLQARRISSIVSAGKSLDGNTPADRFLGLLSTVICIAVLGLLLVGEDRAYKLLSDLSLYLSRSIIG
jgi:hypothetical protein